MIKIIESPREGLQGFHHPVSTEAKVRFINRILEAGFDTVETGSIVSARLIPQMADSLDVLERLEVTGSSSHLMMLAVHEKGVRILADTERVTHISFPFSFTPSFLQLNVNTTVERAFETTALVTKLCADKKKTAVIYISMAFGNPYGDPWSIDLLVEWIGKLHAAGVRIIPLSNVSTEIDASLISDVYSTLIPAFPDIEFGLHLHTANEGWYEKVSAAWEAGCRRFDGVISGMGGCPMAGKELLGNLKTEHLLAFASRNGIQTGIDPAVMSDLLYMAHIVYQ
jgi:hydroxymethylglutaryl-CoA lyase